MVADQAHPTLTAPERSLLDALLDPTHSPASIDPTALAAALKNQHFLDALHARQFAGSLNLQQRLAAATARAIAVLDALLDSDEPCERRLAATALTRVRAGSPAAMPAARPRSPPPPPDTRSSTRPGGSLAPRPPRPLDLIRELERLAEPPRRSAGSDDAPDADPPDPRISNGSHPDPWPQSATDDLSPASPHTLPAAEVSTSAPHPAPSPQSEIPDPQSPAAAVRDTLLSLRLARNQSALPRLLHRALAPPLQSDLRARSRFLSSLVNSPAWTHRHHAFSISESALTDHAATLRATYAAATDPPPSCLIHLVSPSSPSQATNGADSLPWLISSITADSS